MLNDSEITRPASNTGAQRDAGSALVMAVLVSVVVFVLGAMWMSMASHESSASNNDRRRQHAIDAAMAGLVVADSELTGDYEYPGTGSDVVAFGGGNAEFEVTVEEVAGAPLRRLVTSVGHAPSRADPARTVRTVQQEVELEAVGFTYGIFTEGEFDTGSGSTVIGNVYSRGKITLGNKQDHVGDMHTLGDIVVGANQDLTGSLYANGSITFQGSASIVTGSAYAGGNIATGGSAITEGAQAGGTCQNGGGTCVPYSPPPAVTAQKWPSFVYPPTYTSVTGATLVDQVKEPGSSGVFYVDGSVTFGNKDDLWLTGDMTIVATGAIELPRAIINNTTGPPVQLTVISTGAGTITVDKTLTIPATVRTLIYTRGRFEAKNHLTLTGTLYAQDVTAGTKLSVTHAPVSEPGFDWSEASPQSFRIRNISTREVANGS